MAVLVSTCNVDGIQEDNGQLVRAQVSTSGAVGSVIQYHDAFLPPSSTGLWLSTSTGNL